MAVKKPKPLTRLYYSIGDAVRALGTLGYSEGDLLHFGAAAQLELLVLRGLVPMEVSGIRAYYPDGQNAIELMPVDFDVFEGGDEPVFFTLKAKDCAAIELYGSVQVDKFTGAYFADLQFNKLSDYRERCFHDDIEVMTDVSQKKIIANYRPLGVDYRVIKAADLYVSGSEVTRLLNGVEIGEVEKKKLISEPQSEKPIHGRTKNNTNVFIAALVHELRTKGVPLSSIQKTVVINSSDPAVFNEAEALPNSTASRILAEAKKLLKVSS